MPPAARMTDPTTHAGVPLAPGPGSPNVMIGGLPAWRANIDQHACPAASVSGADGVGAVVMGSPTVLINNMMASRMGDVVVEKPGLAMGPMNPIVMGCPTVMIGEAGAGTSLGAPVTVTVSQGMMTYSWGGLGLHGSPADVAAFLQMAQQEAMRSPTMDSTLSSIVGDSAHPVNFEVGRSQPQVFVDSFASGEVDLDDLEAIPADPSPGHPNEATRGELMTHFLAEHYDRSANGNGFTDAHQVGLDTQSQYRAERGQSPVTSQVLTGNKDPQGNHIARLSYEDGTYEDVHIDNNSNIVGIDPP